MSTVPSLAKPGRYTEHVGLHWVPRLRRHRLDRVAAIFEQNHNHVANLFKSSGKRPVGRIYSWYNAISDQLVAELLGDLNAQRRANSAGNHSQGGTHLQSTRLRGGGFIRSHAGYRSRKRRDLPAFLQ